MKVSIGANEYYLPLQSEDGTALIKDNPDWSLAKIEEKTGILRRHISAANQTAVDLGFLAAEKLFSKGVKKDEIDFLILITQSADFVLPTSACILQDRLNLPKSCMAFDVNLGCSGFIYGLAVGGGLIESGLARKGIIICSETYTKYIDRSDRTCRPLFSDGASATLLVCSERDTLGPFEMGTDGSGSASLIVTTGGARNPESEGGQKKLFMNGPDVFMFTMDMLPKCINALLEKSGKKIEDIDLFIFHQASKVVLDNIIRRMNLEKEKVFVNYESVGNVVSASIPIALKDASAKSILKKDDLIMLVGFGVGFSWGACLIRWGQR